jgi:hypothetical protein
LLDQIVVEFAAALIAAEGVVAIGRRLKRVPADQHGARPFGAIELQQTVGKAENSASGTVAVAQDILRQRVVGAMGKRIAVDDQ